MAGTAIGGNRAGLRETNNRPQVFSQTFPSMVGEEASMSFGERLVVITLITYDRDPHRRFAATINYTASTSYKEAK